MTISLVRTIQVRQKIISLLTKKQIDSILSRKTIVLLALFLPALVRKFRKIVVNGRNIQC